MKQRVGTTRSSSDALFDAQSCDNGMLDANFHYRRSETTRVIKITTKENRQRLGRKAVPLPPLFPIFTSNCDVFCWVFCCFACKLLTGGESGVATPLCCCSTEHSLRVESYSKESGSGVVQPE